MTYFVPVEGHVLAVRNPAASLPAPPGASRSSSQSISNSAGVRASGWFYISPITEARLESGNRGDRQQRVTAKRPEAVETFTESALKFIGSHHRSAFAACSEMEWIACSRMSRSRRAIAEMLARGSVDARFVGSHAKPKTP